MSGRLIDAEKLKKHYAWWDDDERRTLFDHIVDAQPEVDAEPVIRCMDCKYWSAEIEQTAIPNMRKCTWWRTIGTLPIDFCSRAERRGEHDKAD